MGFDVFGGFHGDTHEMIPEMFGSLAQGALGVALGVLGVILALILAVGVTFWCLESVGLSTMARRRGIYHAWLAWIPIGRQWVLGCISDQYQYVKLSRRRALRRTLLGLEITKWVLNGGLSAMSWLAERGVTMPEYLQAALGLLGGLALFVIGILQLVFLYIAYYDFFRSADPGNASLYLILGILFSFCLPLFAFAVRNRDDGMPPRKPRAAPAYGPAAQEPQPAPEPAPEAAPVEEPAPAPEVPKTEE